MAKNMNKIDELLKKLCPDGVEFKKLGEVAEIKRGTSITKSSVVEGDVPVIAGGRAPAYFHNVSNRDGQNIVIAGSGAYAGFVSWWEQPIFVSDAFTVKPHSGLFTKYCYYWLQNMQQHLHELKSGGGVPHIYPRDVAPLKIPIPPLPIQQEIVNILDTFSRLEAELEAELEARKKQYEYYRDELLTFGEDACLPDRQVEWKTLGEVALNLDSKRKPITKRNRKDGKYPYYGASGIVDYVNDYIFDGDYLLVSEDGANLLTRVAPIAFSASGKIWVNNHAHVLEFKTYTDRKFVEYYLNMIDLSRFISTAAQPKLTQDNLNKIPIPIPPFAEQERIVAILDKFDALVNDLSIGLPAELNARRKQYEYYRNKLLTFQEKK